MAGPNSRWVKGNERYTKDVQLWIDRTFTEWHGWYKAGRVRRRKK